MSFNRTFIAGLLLLTSASHSETLEERFARISAERGSATPTEETKTTKKKKTKKVAETSSSSDREPASASYHLPSIQQEIDKKKKDHKKQETVAAPSEPQTEEKKAEEPVDMSADHLLGSWFGLRDSLKKHGVEFDLIYKGELQRNMGGGSSIKNMNTENLDFRVKVDAEKLWGSKGLSFMFYGLGNKGAGSGNSPASATGAKQGVSNIEASVDDFKLYEAYAQQLFFEDRMSILFGLHDLNTEFYVTNSSGIFLNPSFCIG